MDLLAEALKMGINITEEKEKSLEKYKEMMLEYNKVVNLTAITDDEEIKEKHFLDCAALTLCPQIKQFASVIDIGAGAGFPSVVLKIMRSDIDITMLDSLNKRISFLNDVIDALGFENARAIHLRAEDGGRRKELREKYDIATARAVSNMAVLSEYALPFVKKGGFFLAMKGPACDCELDEAKPAIKKLGGKICEVKKIELPSKALRSIVIIEKIKETPKEYPRKAGKPAKEPILK